MNNFITFQRRIIEHSSRVVLSLGSGSGATEMISSLPCLCLDNCKRAVFAGIVNLKGNWEGKKMVCTMHCVI